jgi:hypothetical protein
VVVDWFVQCIEGSRCGDVVGGYSKVRGQSGGKIGLIF